jgi:hypothetical protein
MAMQAYSDWAPKELDEDAIGKEAPQPVTPATADAAAANGSTSAAAAGGAPAAADGAWAVDAAAAEGTAAAAPEATAQQQQAAQFEYDPATGEQRCCQEVPSLRRLQAVRMLWLRSVSFTPD